VAANLAQNLQNNCAANGGVNLMLIGGTEDPIMPYDGGEVASLPALGIGAGGNVISYPDTTDFWSAKNQCGTGILTDIDDTTSDGTTVEKLTFDNCAQGSLEAFKINGGGHNWPGSAGNSALSGNVSRDINATNELIDFFKQNGLSPAL
jgi:polyhydroxybutyrate depolymerase